MSMMRRIRRAIITYLVVLDLVVLGVGEAEAVRAAAVLVVDDLGVGAVPAHVLVAGLLGVVVAVLGRGDDLGLVALREDDDVLPVVPVAAGVGDVLHGHVLLEVVAVHVGAPSVVASGIIPNR